MRERLQSMLAPRECPIPISGMGISERKWLIMCKRSRAWSFHDAEVVLEDEDTGNIAMRKKRAYVLLDHGRQVDDLRSLPNSCSFIIPLWPCWAMSAIQILRILNPCCLERARRSSHSGSYSSYEKIRWRSRETGERPTLGKPLA